MPTIIVDKAKGLFQKVATSANPAGSLSGQKSVVKGPFTTTPVTASLNDSGKYLILGNTGITGDPTIALPEMSTANIGYNVKLITTGALEGTHVIQTVTKSTGLSASSDRFPALPIFAQDPDASQDTVTASGNRLTIAAGGSSGAETVVLEVVYVDKNKALVFGGTKT